MIVFLDGKYLNQTIVFVNWVLLTLKFIVLGVLILTVDKSELIILFRLLTEFNILISWTFKLLYMCVVPLTFYKYVVPLTFN